MAEELPMACTLETTALEQRIATIRELGRECLGRSSERDRQLVRFRSAPTVRRRLEQLIEAEAECCSFLEMSIEEHGGELLLTIEAPEQGAPVAAGMAAAFDG
jgi:hypothetical protein